MSKIQNKVETVRHYIIEGITSGSFKTGMPLPSARNIATTLNISFISVLNAISSLTNDGILISSPRRRSYVSPEWKERILPENFVTMYENMPWFDTFKELLLKHSSDELPFKLFSGFKKGMFQIVDTPYFHFSYRDMLDLTPFVSAKYSDESTYFSQPFNACRIDNKFYGIPFSFSPKVVFYNRSILLDAGCRLPGNDWNWDDFTEILQQVRKKLPAEDILNWFAGLNTWLAVILRSGGNMIVEDADGNPKVMLDDPATIRGIKLWRSIKDLLKVDKTFSSKNYCQEFAAGKKAFYISSRQTTSSFKDFDFDSWEAISFPTIPGGTQKVVQTTDIFCVKKNCLNIDIVPQMINLLLSEPIQDFIGKQHYGLPIRKSSAIKSIDFSSPKDTIFLHEISNLCGDYHFGYPEIYELINGGLQRVMLEDVDVDQEMSSLAMSIREFLKIKNYSKQLEKNKNETLRNQ